MVQRWLLQLIPCPAPVVSAPFRCSRFMRDLLPNKCSLLLHIFHILFPSCIYILCFVFLNVNCTVWFACLKNKTYKVHIHCRIWPNTTMPVITTIISFLRRRSSRSPISYAGTPIFSERFSLLFACAPLCSCRDGPAPGHWNKPTIHDMWNDNFWKLPQEIRKTTFERSQVDSTHIKY